MENISAATAAGLIDELHNASQAYYHDQSPVMTDEEFDDKLAFLVELSNDDSLAELFAPGTRGAGLLESTPSLGTATLASDTISHDRPMLSLAKAQDLSQVSNYLRRTRESGATGFKFQAKMDGLAFSAHYRSGTLVSLATRGDGNVGENSTYLAERTEVTITGLPKTVTVTDDFEVRGEAFFTDEQFEKVNESNRRVSGEQFKNPRNAAAGLLKRAKGGLSYDVQFTFAAYSIDGDTELSMRDLPSLGFVTVDELTKQQVNGRCELSGFASDIDLMEAVRLFGELRQSFTFPTDGLVIKPVNEREMIESMGSTSHHPKSQIAFKYPGDKATSKVLAVEVTVGKTGRVTPTVVIEPVFFAGSTVSRASCHNFQWAAERDLRIGSVVTVHKANDIIPQVMTVISHEEGSVPLEAPRACPICATALIWDGDEWPPKSLTCPNEECDSRVFQSLTSAVGRAFLDIDGLSEATMTSLVNSGRVSSLVDLYSLTVEELADSASGYSQNGTARRLGESRAKHIVEQIEKSKSAPLNRWLASLAIPMLGNTLGRILTKKFGSMEAIQALTVDQLCEVPTVGTARAESVVSGLARRRELIDRLRGAGVLFVVPQQTLSRDDKSVAAKGSVQPMMTFGNDGVEMNEKQSSGSGSSPDDATTASESLRGLSFSISGEVPPGFQNRGAWTDFLDDNGASFHSSPKSSTSFMVGDPSGSSSKTKKAISLGVAFISPEEFTRRFV